MKTAHPFPAFTLVELLVVLGIVTLMAGVLGLALRDGDPARGLESAQATLAGLLEAARSRAVVSQNRALLVVDADPANDRFLRGVQVAVESAPHSGLWWITDNGAVLPRGVYVVPGAGNVDGLIYAPGGAPARVWPESRRSSLAEMPASSVTPDADNPSGKYLGMVAPLSAGGLAGAGGGDKIVLTVGRRTSAGVVFEQPEQARGLVLGSYGMAILINDAPGFDF